MSLQSPIEERVRLELNFAEALNEIDNEEAKRRYNETNDLVISTPLDTDVACYCLTRLLITLNKLVFREKSELGKKSRESLKMSLLHC